MVLWGTDADAAALGESLGIAVRAGDLPSLGVNPNGTAASGDGRHYATAVALALSAMGEHRQAVDFLHSRLAPLPVRRIPQWAVTATLALIALVGGAYLANDYQQRQQATLDDLTRKVEERKPTEAEARVFVDKVSFAQRWHGGNPRYLACLRDLTATLPDDHETYATNLTCTSRPPDRRRGGCRRPQGQRRHDADWPAGGQDVEPDARPAGGRPAQGSAGVPQREAARHQRGGRPRPGRHLLRHVRLRAGEAGSPATRPQVMRVPITAEAAPTALEIAP